MEAKKAKIIKGIGGFYSVLHEGNVYVVKAKNKLRHKGLKPMVGDDVLFIPGLGDQNGWLEDILERKNFLQRPPVANIDVLGLMVAPSPKPDYRLIDIMLISAYFMNIEVILISNKFESKEDYMLEDYSKAGYKVFKTSALYGEGIDVLKEELKNKTTCFAGQSGIGKTTLINALLSTNYQTGSISQKISRGKHTTRHVEIIYKDSIRILDTPGFSMIDIFSSLEPEDIHLAYPEFKGLDNCYFKPCMHISEPKCEVLQALKDGKISPDRHKRYTEIVNKLLEQRRNKYD